MNSLPKTVNRQRRDCDLNPGPESSTLTTRLPSHPTRTNFLSRLSMRSRDDHGTGIPTLNLTGIPWN